MFSLAGLDISGPRATGPAAHFSLVLSLNFRRLISATCYHPAPRKISLTQDLVVPKRSSLLAASYPWDFARVIMTTSIDAGITVRPANQGDIAGIIALIEPFVSEGKLLERTIDELAQLMPHCFVAEAAGEIVGCSALEIYSKKLAELRSLCVHPSYQGQGVGQRLVDACLERAARERVLEVLAITSAEQFFRRCGFDFTLPGEKKALFFQTRPSGPSRDSQQMGGQTPVVNAPGVNAPGRNTSGGKASGDNTSGAPATRGPSD